MPSSVVFAVCGVAGDGRVVDETVPPVTELEAAADSGARAARWVRGCRGRGPAAPLGYRRLAVRTPAAPPAAPGPARARLAVMTFVALDCLEPFFAPTWARW